MVVPLSPSPLQPGPDRQLDVNSSTPHKHSTLLASVWSCYCTHVDSDMGVLAATPSLGEMCPEHRKPTSAATRGPARRATLLWIQLRMQGATHCLGGNTVLRMCLGSRMLARLLVPGTAWGDIGSQWSWDVLNDTESYWLGIVLLNH